ncbi:hypothetical protein BAE44_0025625 [Dichanthelium oligosanthes]|uniref:Uncharacterized protein n=1 Tax=Dichanthelium oligosanthes TaxID=888268 RepID=A0A1E5UKN5_9POAL|nr:hypothetical protein BAE44_0025625 [Dichanthelium oligosanthes]
MPTAPIMAMPPPASISSLISFIQQHLRALLADPAALHAARRRCLALLAPRARRHRRHDPPHPTEPEQDDDDEAVLAALHDAINALLPASSDGVTACLAGVEEALQAPALLPEHGETAGLDNQSVAACAYFYLALVRCAQGDAWQMAMDLLQAVAVCPAAGRLAPRALWEGLFDEGALPSAGGAGEEDAARRVARRYKDWLMYYKVVAAAPDAGGVENGGCVQLGRSGNSVISRWLNSSEDRTTRSVDHEGMSMTSASRFRAHDGFAELKDFLSIADQDFQEYTKGSSDSRCLHEMLEESQSDSPVSFYSHLDSSEESDSEAAPYNKGRSAKIMPIDADFLAAKLHDRSSHNKNMTWCTSPENAMIYAPESPMFHVDDREMKLNGLQSNRSHGSLNNLSNSVLELKNADSYSTSNYSTKDGMFPQCSPRCDLRCFSNFSTKFIKKSSLSDLVSIGSMSRKFKTSTASEGWSDVSSHWGKDSQVDFLERFEKAVSKLLVSDGLECCLDAGSEVTTIWQLLNNTSEVRYKSSVRQDILDQLLDSISMSKKDKVIKASVYVLLLMISEDRNMMRGIKRKDFHLSNLATALKRDVHEAAILIYLLDPTPLEIKNLDLLPSLLHVACNSDTQKWPAMLPLTPTSASIALIEILVTAFDYVTNNVHLASLSSPPILSKLVDVAKNNNLEEGVALAAILIRCVRLNGNCKKFLSQATPVDPFLHLLRRKEHRAKCAALEYFHEILQIPRSSAKSLLQEIRRQGGIAIMHTLMASLHQTEPEHRVLAASLLLQLDLMEKSDGRSVFQDEAMEVLLDSLSSQENSRVQALSASFLSNLGGTYSWCSAQAWDIKGQRAVIIREVKEHKKAVTCFALSETGENLLSGSADKSIRVWEMAQHKLECVEVIQTREAVQKLEIFGDKILVLTQNNVIKFSCASRSSQTLYRGKHVKSLAVCQGKAYLGCTDLSIQDWKKRCKPNMTVPIPNGTSVKAMAVVEDFIYMNCSKSPSIIQIWLREKQQKVGRLSAGSKITSLFIANDMILCGTETGLIKVSMDSIVKSRSKTSRGKLNLVNAKERVYRKKKSIALYKPSGGHSRAAGIFMHKLHDQQVLQNND